MQLKAIKNTPMMLAKESQRRSKLEIVAHLFRNDLYEVIHGFLCHSPQLSSCRLQSRICKINRLRSVNHPIICPTDAHKRLL